MGGQVQGHSERKEKITIPVQLHNKHVSKMVFSSFMNERTSRKV